MKKFSLFTVASLFLLAGCSESDDNLETNQNNTIEFRSVVNKSRASLVGQTSDLENFFVVGKQVAAVGGVQTDFMSASVYLDGSTWTYSPKKYWPTNGEVVNFYAFAPYSNAIKSGLTEGSNGSAEFSYTVPADQSGQNTAVDLLVATTIGDAVTNASTAVFFEFTHALSAATFSAKNANVATSELVYTINKIEITNLDNTGTYNYTTKKWAPTSNNVIYAAGIPKSGVAVQPGANAIKLLSENDVMMVLPQEPDATAKVVITYSLKDGSGAYIYESAEKTLDLPTPFEFEAGVRYNFAFDFASDLSGSLNAITFKVEVTDWNDPYQDEDLTDIIP